MRRIGKILRGIAFALLALAAAGAIFEAIATAHDAKTVGPPGRMVMVDGHRVHVVAMGNSGPTYVLDSGLSGWSVFWYRMQPLLAAGGRTYAIDRPGMGWSDPAPDASDAIAAADQMARIVDAAQIPKPFIYIGHSLGANFAEVYAAKRPGDVAAIVLFEPGDPHDLIEDFKGTRAQAMQVSTAVPRLLAGVAGRLGLTRLMSMIAPGRSFSGPSNTQYHMGLARPGGLATEMGYLAALPKTAYECMDVTSFGDLPVLAFASTELREPEGKETPADVVKWRAGYLEHLAALVARSSRGRGPVVIPSSNHKSMVLGESQAATAAAAIAAFARDNGLGGPPPP